MTNGNDSVDSLSTLAGILQGLTKREYFATMTLQGLLANNTYSTNKNVKASDLVQSAVGAADMLINELNKGVN